MFRYKLALESYEVLQFAKPLAKYTVSVYKVLDFGSLY